MQYLLAVQHRDGDGDARMTEENGKTPLGSPGQALAWKPFGPIAPFAKIASFDEGIERANRFDYGFAAYLFTASVKTAALAQLRLRAGNIGINQMSPSLPHAPVGGKVASGYGYEGGREGIEEFLHYKLVSQTWG